MEACDQDLVALSAGGDRSAFATLVARYQTLVCSIAYSVTGDFARSEDIGQESFIAAWKQLGELNDASRFKSWISSIARNLALNTVRRENTVRFGKLLEAPDTTPSPLETAAMKEEQSLVSSALARLPENYRTPLVLFYRQDQSIVEVAAALEVSADVAKQRLSRGRKLLRNEMLAVVERTLKHTTPSKAFTVTVIAAIPTLASTTTAAAASSATVLAKAGLSGGAKAGGILGSTMGSVIGFGGAALGTWASWSTAQYQSQRDFIRRSTIVYVVGMAIFMMPFAAMKFGWRPLQHLGTNGYLIAYGAWMGGFMIANFTWMFVGFRRWKQITNREQAAGAIELPLTATRRWAGQWEGRRWSSRRKFLGSPIVAVAFSDPASKLAGSLDRSPGIARGWIAIGDHARGLILAIGNTAVAPIAIGTMSVGVISCGVMSVGVISVGVLSLAVVCIGVLSLGVWSLGAAVAIGFLAAGPVAIASEAASGPLAIAFEFAAGSHAVAEHAGDPAANQYFSNSFFFQIAAWFLNYAAAGSRSQYWLWGVLILPIALLSLLRIAYRRKSDG